MKYPIWGGGFLFLFLAEISRAVTFSVAPNSVSNDYAGPITFTVTGLSAGDAVQVVQHYDFNSNGVIDAADLAVRGETITDGDARLVGTNVNMNLVRDEDGATNGAITATYRFAFSPPAARSAGQYVFECKSPLNHFATLTAPFTVASAAYAQTVQGAVKCNATNVPFATVRLMEMETDANPRFIVGTTADATGHYSFKAPTGAFVVAAYQVGCVGNLASFPQVNITPSATVNADVTLVAADRTIFGSVVDSGDTNQHPIPFAEVSVATTNNDVTMALCDGNGNFSAPITSGRWAVKVLPQSAAAQACLVPDDTQVPCYDATGGNVSNALALVKRGTTLVLGRLVDNVAQPIAGVDLVSSVDGGQFDGWGLSDSNGDYAIALDAGAGDVDFAYPNDPPVNNYLWTSPGFGVDDGQSTNIVIAARPATLRVRSRVTDDFGVPLMNVHALIYSYDNSGFAFGDSDANGFVDMPAYGGMWNFQILDARPGFIFPNGQDLHLTDGVNTTNNVVAPRATGSICGDLLDAQSNGVPNILVFITNHVGTTNFIVQVGTDANGHFSGAVFNGTWNVFPYLLENPLYAPVASTNVVVPSAAGCTTFYTRTVPPPRLTLMHVDVNGSTFCVNGGAGLRYTLQSTLDFTDWTNLLTTNAPTDVFYITDTNQMNAKTYYRLRVGQ